MSPQRILIVEDQREVSRLLRSALLTLEYELEVIEIPSGEEAILDSSRNKIDLLVSDYRLPGMTGIELMHKVQKYHPKAKIILITGMTDPHIRKEVAEAGADAFFIKPVPMADFLDAVERHLNLIETILPPEPISMDDEEVQRNLPDMLAGLRQDLAATAVFLMNDTGQIQARAGDLPDRNNEVALISSLLSIYSAGQKVSRIIEQKIASSWFVFNGGKFDLLLAPVGSTHALLVIGDGIAGDARVLQTVEIFSGARNAIGLVIGEKTQNIPALRDMHIPAPEGNEQGMKEMEPLFKEAKKKLKSSEVDDFWSQAADKHVPPAKPDMLSYDQAKQLGLAPEDES